MLAWLLPLVATGSLLATREVLTDFPAQKALLQVRYALENNFPECGIDRPIHNVTVLDPSFNRSNVRFEDGRRKAKVTFGTIKPGETPYVNLDMFPKQAGNITLEAYSITYNRNDTTAEQLDLPAAESFYVTTYRDFAMRESGWTHAAYALLAAVPVGVAPLALAYYLKQQRRVIYKNLKGQ